MINIFCDYIGLIIPEKMNLGNEGWDGRSHNGGEPMHTFMAKWHAKVYSFLDDKATIFPDYVSFGFLESRDVCRKFEAWETPYTVYKQTLASSENKVNGWPSNMLSTNWCGSGYPYPCGFGLFTPYHRYDFISEAGKEEVGAGAANESPIFFGTRVRAGSRPRRSSTTRARRPREKGIRRKKNVTHRLRRRRKPRRMIM